MKRTKLFTLILSIVLICFQQADAKKYEASWESLGQHETPEWFENSVLGIYFHWGIYSVPAFGCWGGRNMYQPDGGT
ncbi:MAG: alpha-L-fucosidase, partial [Planctomycetota bacterium]